LFEAAFFQDGIDRHCQPRFGVTVGGISKTQSGENIAGALGNVICHIYLPCSSSPDGA
jgi:hypothetical protein